MQLITVTKSITSSNTNLTDSCAYGIKHQLYEDTTPTSLINIPNVDSGKLRHKNILTEKKKEEDTSS